MNSEGERILGVRRNVFFLGLVSFFNDFSAEMVQSVMPIFLTTVLGAPASFVGFIEGLADALASVLKLFSGWFSDRIGKRKLPAVLGYVLSVGVRPFLATVANFWQVLNLRIVDRIGKGFRDSPRDALIVESVEKGELGKSFGFHRSMDTLGSTFGPLLAFALLPFIGGDTSAGFRMLFLIAFVIGLFAVFSFVWVKERPRAEIAAELASLYDSVPFVPSGAAAESISVFRTSASGRSGLNGAGSLSGLGRPRADVTPAPSGERSQRDGTSGKNFGTGTLNVAIFKQNKKFILVVGTIFIFGLGTLPIGLVLLKTREVGLSLAAFPLMYFIYSLAFVLTAVPLGKLSDRIGERLVISGGFLVAALSYFGLASTGGVAATTLLFIMLGLYQAATDGLERVLAAKYVSRELLATGQGFLNMAIGFSSLGAGVIGGSLWTSSSSGAALNYAGIVSLVGLVLFWVMSGRKTHAV